MKRPKVTFEYWSDLVVAGVKAAAPDVVVTRTGHTVEMRLYGLSSFLFADHTWWLSTRRSGASQSYSSIIPDEQDENTARAVVQHITDQLQVDVWARLGSEDPPAERVDLSRDE